MIEDKINDKSNLKFIRYEIDTQCPVCHQGTIKILFPTKQERKKIAKQIYESGLKQSLKIETIVKGITTVCHISERTGYRWIKKFV